jgi:hypothetical protein
MSAIASANVAARNSVLGRPVPESTWAKNLVPNRSSSLGAGTGNGVTVTVMCP